MKLTKSNGETTLVVEPGEFDPFLRTIGSYDNDTPKALKARLGKILDPVLQGQKLDYITVNNDPYGRGEILTYIYRYLNLKYDNGKRSAIVLAEYISGRAISRLMDTYPGLQKLFRQDYDTVMGQLNEKASEFRTQGRNAELQYGIQTEAEKRGLVEGTYYEGERLPPPEYREFLPKYGARRSRVTHSRPVRSTRKRKVTLRTIRLKSRVIR